MRLLVHLPYFLAYVLAMVSDDRVPCEDVITGQSCKRVVLKSFSFYGEGGGELI